MTLELLIGGLLTSALLIHIRARSTHAKISRIASIRPDRPKNFGDDISWIAVAARRPEDVMRLLDMTNAQRANWSTGMSTVVAERATPRRVFVSPRVTNKSRRHRLFLVGLPLPMPIDKRQINQCRTLLEGLSATFGEAEYFTITEHLGLFAWAKAIDGQVVRAFSFGEHGIAWNEGAPTRDESEIGLRIPKENFGTRNVSGPARRMELLTYPKKAHIIELSKRWSISPFSLHNTSRKFGRGFLADLKPRK